ncbi:MAG TPA: hypothetical protein VIT62_15825 [Lysobacter sp.]
MRMGSGLLAVIVVAWLSWQQLRVDANVGAAFGPDRRITDARGEVNDAQTLKAIARATLRDRPIDAGAFRLLGLAARLEGDPERAGDLFRTAARRSPRDEVAQAMLVDELFAQGRVAQGMRHVDALLRVAPRMRAPVLASLIANAANPELRSELARVLATNPPWREAFPSVLRGSDAMRPDPARSEAVLASLAGVAALTPSELAARIEALTALGQPAQARAIWLQSLPQRERRLDGLPFDGGFEGDRQIGGFGWWWDDESGALLSLDANERAQGRQSLQAQFSGRAVRFAGPRQRLALAPGRYEISSAANDRTSSSRRFAWFIQCTSGVTLVRLELPAASTGGWQNARTQFDVPRDCLGQQLTLRHTGRSMAERQIGGTLHVDNVRLRNLPGLRALQSASRRE